MAIRNIFTDGEPILRKRSREVEVVDDKIRTILDDMRDTMNKYEGVGIAAPQVGLLKRIFIMAPDEETYYELVNPEIIEMEGSQEGEEGCLSAPGYIGTVTRPERIKIKALDRDGNKNTYDFIGFSAIVACHEFDHLEGILYIDKARDIRQVGEE